MTPANPTQSIAHKLRITDADIREREALLGRTAADEVNLARHRPAFEPQVDGRARAPRSTGPARAEHLGHAADQPAEKGIHLPIGLSCRHGRRHRVFRHM